MSQHTCQTQVIYRVSPSPATDSSSLHYIKWSDDQNKSSRAQVSARAQLPSPQTPLLKDLVSSLVWWESDKNIRAYIPEERYLFLIQQQAAKRGNCVYQQPTSNPTNYSCTLSTANASFQPNIETHSNNSSKSQHQKVFWGWPLVFSLHLLQIPRDSDAAASRTYRKPDLPVTVSPISRHLQVSSIFILLHPFLHHQAADTRRPAQALPSSRPLLL